MPKLNNRITAKSLSLKSIDLIGLSMIYTQRELMEIYDVSRSMLQREVRKQRENPKGYRVSNINSEELNELYSVGAWIELKKTMLYKEVMFKNPRI